MSRDGYAGLAIAAASLVLYALTLDLKDNPMVPLGPGFYPRAVLALTAALSLGLAIADLIVRRKPEDALAAAKPDKLNYPLVALSFGVFALYCVALPGFGFRVSTFAYVVASNALLAPLRGTREWAGTLILGLATSLATWFVFEHWLSVLLPRGTWTGF